MEMKLGSINAKKTRVAILFNNSFNFQIMKTILNLAGRFISCNLKTNGKCLSLANVYAPNEDDANFFHSFFWSLVGF